MTRFHLAQINVARMRAPLTDPLMAPFVARLEAVNALADASPGFVWRLQGEQGDATDIRAYADPQMLVNLSVWQSVEALHAYVYRSDHTSVMRDRKQWFERMAGPYLALWWVPAGHRPTVEEGKARLEMLAARGPTADAFTFRQPFSPGAPRPESAGFEGCAWAT
jgi:Domain of unknown function (DUF3291)